MPLETPALPVTPDDMSAELRCALDTVALAEERLNFQPDPWQARVMQSPAKRVLLNCSRQAGKSTCTAIIGLHRALYYRKAKLIEKYGAGVPLPDLPGQAGCSAGEIEARIILNLQ